MYNLNKAMVEGNLTRDPEMKALPSGQSVTTFSLATNRRYKDKDGALQEEVEFHNITVWGKQAESVNTYLKKGSSAMVIGRLQTRSWEKDGAKHYRTEIVAEDVTFGAKPQTSTVSDTGVAYPEGDDNTGDVPF